MRRHVLHAVWWTLGGLGVMLAAFAYAAFLSPLDGLTDVREAFITVTGLVSGFTIAVAQWVRLGMWALRRWHDGRVIRRAEQKAVGKKNAKSAATRNHPNTPDYVGPRKRRAMFRRGK